MQVLIDDFYGVLVSIVSNAPGIDEDRVREIATGGVFELRRPRNSALSTSWETPTGR